MQDRWPSVLSIVDRGLRPSRLLLRLFPLVIACSFAERVYAQAVGMVAGAEGDAAENQNQLPFLLPVQPTEIAEAMEDFRRFAGRKQWEKAFKHLEKIFNATSNGLVLTDDGILLPSRLIAREALLQLSPAGQDAYRLFFDAEAKKLLEQAQGPEELNKLTQVFSKYLVTSSGDEAANKLGDLHFEAGDFSQAVYAWRAILEERPDSRISRARLRVKIAVSLARQGHWTEFREALKTVEAQHAAEKLTFGGREVSAVDYLRGLAERGKEAAVAVPGALANGGRPADLSLAGTIEPLWQFRFFPNPDPAQGNLQPGLRVQQQWGPTSMSDLVPPVVTDASRLYANFLGYDLGVDLENGKLIWRSGRFFDAPQKLQQLQQQGGQLLERFGIAASPNRLWSVAIDTKNPQQQQMGRQQGGKFEIVAREVDTGKQVFSSQQATEFKEWSFHGNPLPAGDRVYVTAGKLNQPNELHLLALNARDGNLLWSAMIGNYTAEQNYYWYGQMERGTQPTVLLNGGKLYVDSHAGSLVQLDAASGQVEWGLNYLSDTQQAQRFWYYEMRAETLTLSPPQLVNGVLYIKGMKSRRLYAVDPQRPKLLWHRPVPKTAVLIGVDEDRFYLGGEDISAYDLKTRKILWSVKLNLATSYAQPLLTQNRIYYYSSRGIYEIDKAEGRVMNLLRGADLQSLGGTLHVTPKALLAVSNLAVTAFPLSGGNASGAASSSAAVVPAGPTSQKN